MNGAFDFYSVEFKTGQYVKKVNWRTVPLGGLISFWSNMNRKRFVTGQEALWVKPVVSNSGGRSYPWLLLDIEAPGSDHHSDILANLEAAREFLAFILENRLETGLVVFLSGKGLRFCWPYLITSDLQKAFAMWIRSPEYRMIDHKPYTNRAFYRMFANRNHPNQGAVLNRHIQRLDTPHDLWFMSEQDYLGYVAGSIELSECLPWLAEIIPVSFTPEPWIEFLNKYKVLAALADTIYKPILPARKHRKPIAYITEQAGHEFRRFEFHGGEILQLKNCPVCGRSDGRPYITQSGRLKCHHANSCVAGSLDESGRIIGIPVSEWLPGGIAEDFDTDGIQPDDSDRISIQAARDVIRTAFKDNGNAYITLSPGAGKTHSVLLEILADETHKVAIATPEHKLNQELYELAVSRAKHPERVHVLRGRNETNCTQFQRVQEVSKAGYPPGVILCSRCKQNRQKNCAYNNQFDSLKDPSGLWIMTHAMSLELKLINFDLLVVDESPLKIFLQKSETETGAFDRIRSIISPSGREVLDKLMAIIPAQLAALESEGTSNYDLSRIYVSEAPPETPWAGQPGLFEIVGITLAEVSALDASLSSIYQWDEEKYPQYLKRLFFDERIDFSALKWLQGAITRETGAYIRFKRDPKHPAKFVHFEKRLPKYKGRIISLDATGGSMAEIETLFERKFRHIHGLVEMPGLRTAHVKQATGKLAMSRKADKQIGDMIQAAAEFLKPTDMKILICTHMAIEETVKRLAAEILPCREIQTCHFWGGSRGVNQFGDCTAVVSLGQPFPNIGGLFDHAMTLIPDPSERVQWIANTGTSELIQALHRVRPVKGDRTVIHIGKDFPVKEFGQPVFKISRSRGRTNEPAINEILERLSPAVEEFGIMTKAIGWMFGVCLKSDFDKMKQAHEMIENNIENGNDEYFKKYEFYVKKAGKRKSVTSGEN